MVGISGFEQGAVIGGRYRIVERLTRFSAAGHRVAGVEYEFWLALDETRDAEVWLQVAASRDTVAGGGRLAASVAALRRLNHPAIPVVLDFGEIEVVGVEAAAAGSFAAELEDAVLTAYGYVVLAPVEGESFAFALARATLTEVEILAVLIQLVEVMDLIHEVELVHGHLSAHSLVLVEEEVLLIDLAVSLAIEAEAGGALSPAADIYSLAWLACIAFAGIEAVEAEFGFAEELAFSPEDVLAPAALTLELVEHRRMWAELTLVEVYGVGAHLAALIVLALGEAATRPSVGEFILAMRGRRAALLTGEVEFLAAGAAAGLAGAEVAAEFTEVAAVGAEEIAVVSAAEETAVVMEAQALIQEAGRKRVAEAAVAGAVLGVVGAEAATGFETGSESAATTVLPKVAPVYSPPTATRPPANRPQGARTRNAGRPPANRPPAASHRTTAASPAPSGSSGGGGGFRHRKTLVYIGAAAAVVILGGTAWALSGGSSPSTPVASVTTNTPAASASAGQVQGTPTHATTAQAGASTPSAAASASAGSGAGASPTAAASAAFTPSPLATAPGSPSQAIQQIQQVISQGKASGRIPSGTLTKLNQTVSTLQKEIGSGSSVIPGVTQLQQIISGHTLPASVSSQLVQLIPFLSPVTGS